VRSIVQTGRALRAVEYVHNNEAKREMEADRTQAWKAGSVMTFGLEKVMSRSGVPKIDVGKVP